MHQSVPSQPDITQLLLQQPKAIAQLSQQISQQQSHPEMEARIAEQDQMQAKLDGIYQCLGLAPFESSTPRPKRPHSAL